MADDTLRELNEAVIPTKFSLEGQRREEAEQAKYRLSDEGFQPPAPSPLNNAIDKGGIPLVQNDRTEFGIALGRQDRHDDDDLYEHWTDQQNQPIRRGKSAGFYVNFKF